jgi:hypothetical protein
MAPGVATATVPRLYGIAALAMSGWLGDTSPWTLRKHITLGNIRVVRLGSRLFVHEDEIRRIQRDGLPPLRCRSGSNTRSVGGHIPSQEARA